MDTHLISGVVAGVFTSCVLHPLDTLKTTLQVQDGKLRPVQYTNLMQAVKGIYKEAGVTGFYRGILPACWGSGLSWGLYFFLYERCKRRLARNAYDSQVQKQDAPHGTVKLTTRQHMYAAWEGGTLTALLTNPIWLVKTRMQLRDAGYTGILNAFKRIVAEEGVFALYKGIVPALFLVSHGMIQFGIYEAAKDRAGPHPSSAYLFVAGAVSKAAATGLSYPYQVVKSRLQQVQGQGVAYAGFVDCVKKTAAAEGWKGFYKGFSANVLRVAPQSAVTLVAYENSKRILHALRLSS